MNHASCLNPSLLKMAQDQLGKLHKASFLDPSGFAGGGPGGPGEAPGGAPGGDPSAAGGGGGDPSGGGGGGMSPDQIVQLVQTAVGQAMQQQGGAAGAGGAPAAGGAKKKVDVNTEVYQIKKMLAMLFNYLNIPIPAHMLLGHPADDPDAQAMAQQEQGGGQAPQSAIQPIEGMGAANPQLAAASGGGGGGMKQSEDSTHVRGISENHTAEEFSKRAAATRMFVDAYFNQPSQN